MTTLPVAIPPDYSLVVKKGDHVEMDAVLAKAPEQEPSNELLIDLVAIFNAPANTVRKYLLKGPGDSVHEGEVIASHSYSLGLKKDEVQSHVSGTVVRFERDTGKLIIQTDEAVNADSRDSTSDILSPLAGTIKVCNNDAIVIDPDKEEEVSDVSEPAEEPVSELPKVKAGEKGINGKAKGLILVLSPETENGNISSNEITKETIGKILLLPDISKEAVAKASAIGVAGILGTDLSADLFKYVEDRKIDLPIISIDQTLGKKLMKSKKEITMNGKDQTVTDED